MLLKGLSLFSLAPKTTFVNALLKSQTITGKIQRIHSHTFNIQLFNGTLNAPTFGQYLHDDDIYLRQFAPVINKLSLRLVTQNPTLAEQLQHLSLDIIAGEQSMQEQYKDYFTRKPESEPGKAVTDYIKFINAHAENSDTSVALSSVLPCFLIYYQLGSQTLSPNQLAVNPFKSWIKTYQGLDFVKATHTLTDAVNEYAEQSNLATQSEMKTAFEQAVDHELAFFDEVDPAKTFAMVMPH